MKKEQELNSENVKNGMENNNIDKTTKEQTVSNKIDRIKQIKNLKNKKIENTKEYTYRKASIRYNSHKKFNGVKKKIRKK